MEEISPKSNRKKFPVAVILLVVAVFAAAYLVPAIGKSQFQKSTDADFVSVPNRDLDESDLENMKADYDKTKELLNKNGYDLEANLVKADVLFRMQEYDKAIIIYKKMQELNPSDARSFQGLGDLYFSQKKYTQSEGIFAAALEKNPKSVEAYLKLAMVYRSIGKDSKEKETVKKFYEDGIQNLGDDKFQLVDMYASYLERIGENDKAMEELNVLLASSPDDQDLKDRIATLQAKMVPAPGTPTLAPGN